MSVGGGKTFTAKSTTVVLCIVASEPHRDKTLAQSFKAVSAFGQFSVTKLCKGAADGHT